MKPERLEKAKFLNTQNVPQTEQEAAVKWTHLFAEHVSRGLAAAADINHEYFAVCLNINSLYFCIFIIWFDVMNRLCPRP